MMIGIYLLFQILGPCSYQGSKEGSWSGRSWYHSHRLVCHCR
jgi:hypothetical protein